MQMTYRLYQTIDSFDTIGDMLSDEDLVFFALMCLPSDYENFVMNIELMKLSITFTELRA